MEEKKWQEGRSIFEHTRNTLEGSARDQVGTLNGKGSHDECFRQLHVDTA